VGVIGRTGRGIEEHFDAIGTTDVLMGTLSKTLGALGGYVVGDQDLIDYLRWYAPSGLFTTTLPAPICAGVRKALELVVREPEHRQRLWSNIHRFVPPLEAAGFKVSGTSSPIVTVFVGQQETLWKVSRDLYEAGIKAGNVIYPAVPREGCILRFTMNARHTDADIDRAVDTLVVIGKRYGLI
jgi:glycine C-acetyltransferase